MRMYYDFNNQLVRIKLVVSRVLNLVSDADAPRAPCAVKLADNALRVFLVCDTRTRPCVLKI
jgi:hypothetical protein